MSGDRKILTYAIGVTVFVHAIIMVTLATATGTADLDATQFPLAKRLCDDIRCPDRPVLFDRRLPDEGDAADVGVIDATVVPLLGLAAPKPGELPKLTKYEQPEKIEEAVNITKDNTKEEELKNKAALAKKAELDKQKKDHSLASLLGAPEDDDPRRRPTELSKIVGQRDGSVYGSGTEWKEGNVYGGKVALSIRQQFTVPPFLNDADLKKLRVRIRITKLSESGQVLAFDIVENSSNPAFNAAAASAIKHFVPKEGGMAYLPAPDAKTLQYINSNGMLVDLDGALFRK